jgi:hypothetical protein
MGSDLDNNTGTPAPNSSLPCMQDKEPAYGAASLLFSGFLRRLTGVLAQPLRRAEAKK